MKKPFYLRAWFIILVVVAIAAVVIGINGRANSSEIVFENGKTFTAKELRKVSNDSLYLNQNCTVTMKVKKVSSDFMILYSPDGVEIEYKTGSLSNADKALIMTLSKGDLIEVKGKLCFIGTLQIAVEKITSVKLK